jgi:hypothetical protein
MEKRKFLPYRDSNSDPSVVQPVASRYTGSFLHSAFSNYRRTRRGQLLSAKEDREEVIRFAFVQEQAGWMT